MSKEPLMVCVWIISFEEEVLYAWMQPHGRLLHFSTYLFTNPILLQYPSTR